MNFFLNTDIVLELGAAQKLPEYIREAGFSRPGILYDAVLDEDRYATQVFDAVRRDLPDARLHPCSCKGEPTYAYLESVAEQMRSFGPDGMVGIGGGSVMDLAKGVALLQTNRVKALSLKGFPENISPPLGVITVPSLLGSGAEVSYNAVFIDEDEERKLGINSRMNFPVRSVIDPRLSMGAPMESVISSAMDSLVHCVDSFGSVRHTDLSRMFSVEGFLRTFYALRQGQLDRAESRIDLALGSICGTVALMNSGDGPTNGFAYYLGVQRGIPHGMAGAVFLREVMSYNVSQGYDKYAVLNPMHETGSPHQSALQLLEQLDELYRQLEIPDLAACGYSAETADTFVRGAADALQGSFAGNPVPFTVESAREVVGRLL
ncbi:iron-containing alcohol dehydrogenase [Prosthecochloris sp. N3]|uniref:Iron-containing alcohol dehydrogenase n=1 Tax=Prosthecochloris ethylica TaxID=2743976 RepID=A0ABR9XPG4_9CHLB|nr:MULTISPECIES: iron-containing alcohol dehydrogenase [Prosthecochloris]MBF0586201.1 iron-containing alcohol dehydrogenase [Prosthecochloris ethylica]MBF0635907.1 iron-containing alcohol dehydrogenase [Prosthecochloris ethylica]NUK47418.1 iron-containing alcohol dehydrogenase [Prosthecochloris ethylica]RNA64968.1 iron-containing alcohol dehydrogenase [Prosthecochloris sp. ZM_2]